ncbi:MAG: class I SAM-dependent methyltransferase [Ktedonobacteraceae bacterium]
MPTIEQNLQVWGKSYDRSQQGDEWSSSWGQTELLWWGTLFPRIQAFVPTDTILEIAPGFGRLTQYLKDLCTNLMVVDIAERCIEACKQRFSSSSHITYYTNNGKTLDMIPDQSVDYVFSFDSLVHAEADVIEVYLSQLARILKPDGIGFIHHSNAGAYFIPLDKCLPPPLKEFAMKKLRRHWRAESMTARLFEQYCEQAGLQCIAQELINWEIKYPFPIDCFSLFTQKDSVWTRPNKVFRNMDFRHEALYLGKLSRLYSI